jgi:amino acid adenylation domain-containing protein
MDNIFNDPDIEMVLPLSTTQRDLYLDCLKYPHRNGHQLILYSILEKKIDLDLWKQNLDAFVWENPVLRTELVCREEQICQVIKRKAAPLFTYIDRSAEGLLARDCCQVVHAMKFPDQDLRHPLVHHYLLKITEECYIVLCRVHHVLIDGSSMKIFAEKIGNRYFDLVRNGEMDLCPDHSFQEYIPRHLELFDKEGTVEFWRERLSAIPVTDGQYGVSFEDRIVSDIEIISEEHRYRIKTFCKTNRIQDSYYWFAIFALTARYQLGLDKDFCLRTLSHGRRIKDGDKEHTYKESLGCFYHVIPVVFDAAWFGKERTFRELAVAIAGDIYGLGEKMFISTMHQNAFLGKECLALYYNYQPFRDVEVDGEKAIGGEIYHEMGNHIEIRIAYTHNGLELLLDYNEHYFNGYHFLRRMAYLSSQLTGGVVRLKDLQYLMPDEPGFVEREDRAGMLTSILSTWPDAWREAVVLYAERTAVDCDGLHYSYRTLDNLSDNIARFLVGEACVKKGEIIGLLMPGSFRTMAWIIGIWKAGAAYLPLRPDWPGEWITAISRTAGLRYLICESGDHSILPASREITVWPADQLPEQASEETILLPRLNGKDLAYVIFTSGSTGTPKGVCIEHAGMMNHMLAKKELLGLTEQDAIAQTATITFDISIWQMFNALLAGGRTVIFRNERVIDISRFLLDISLKKITLLEVVPEYLRVMLREMEGKENRFETLRYLVATGEALPVPVANEWISRYPQIPLINAYGPTEASDDITHYFIRSPFKGPRVPIGYPIENMRIYIINGAGWRCGPYMQGEIYVAGIGVGRGYISEEPQTGVSFCPDLLDPAIRMYKTGDKGRWLPDGAIDLIGREDSQVKLYGYRMELSEIEAVIEAHPQVERALVMVDKTREEGAGLYCFYISAQETQNSGLRHYAGLRLPEYMIPRYFIPVGSFPLTPNGKIDTKALAAIRDGFSVSSVAAAIPQQWQTHPLYRAWCSVLGVTNVAGEDNFFEKGGDSIKAMKLVSRIRKELKMDIHVSALFQHPSFGSFLNMLPHQSAEMMEEKINSL